MFLPENQPILNAVSEGIYGFDFNGHAVFINPAAEKITRWKAKELLGTDAFLAENEYGVIY